eukprot:PhF_6_TR837/c0_g1_i1/m.1263/K02183/CALM; calmodulin
MSNSEEATWRLYFSMFDLDNSGSVSKQDIKDIIRICGRHYTNTQLDLATQELPDKVTVDKFLSYMRNSVYKGPSDKDLLTALQAFDLRESGELSRADLLTALTTMSDKLSNAEAEEILKALTFGEKDSVSIPVIQDTFLLHPAQIKCTVNDVLQTCSKR